MVNWGLSAPIWSAHLCPPGVLHIQPAEMICMHLTETVCVQEYEAAQLQELGNLLKGLRYAPPVAFELVLGKLAGRSK